MAKNQNPPLWFQVFYEIGIIHQLATTALERALPDGLSMAGFGVLNHLSRLPGDWGPARLARAFQVTKGAMTNTVQRLEALGFVTLDDDPADRRAKFVRVTPTGLAASKDAIARLSPLLVEMEKRLGADLARQTLPLLQTLRADLDTHR